MVAIMFFFLPSCFSILSITTAIEWGISWSVNCNTFSLINSEITKYSGESVITSSGYILKLGCKYFFVVLSRLSTLIDFRAEIGTISTKSYNSL